jgi:hypothetical protein
MARLDEADTVITDDAISAEARGILGGAIRELVVVPVSRPATVPLLQAVPDPAPDAE